MQLVAQAANYTISRIGKVVTLTVHKRPDRTLEQGAADAAEMMDVLVDVLENEHGIAGIVVDLREAPLPGPKTKAALGNGLGILDARSVRVAILVDHPTMKMMFGRMQSEHAPEHGHVTDERSEAELWAGGMPKDVIGSTSA